MNINKNVFYIPQKEDLRKKDLPALSCQAYACYVL